MFMQRGIIVAFVSMMALRGTAEAVSSRAKAEFTASMNRVVRDKKRVQEKGRKNKLRRALLKKAVPVTNDAKRKMNSVLRKLEDGEEEEEYYEEPDYGAFNFDASKFSVKYSGCAVISQLNGLGGEDGGDNGEDDNGGIYSSKKFVTFRLCPSDTCSDNSFYGCKKNYGEYMMLMEDYLNAFAEYNEKVFEYYCDYCEQCLYFEQYFYGNRDLEDAEAAADDQAAAGDDGETEEEEVAEYGSDDDSHACKYYNECVNYLDVCDADANQDDQEQDEEDDYYVDVDYNELFECVEVNNGDDDSSALWVGPHCGDDHKTISIGVFSDQYCTQYVGDDVDIVALTKMKIEEDGLSDYYDESCVTCKESDLPYNIAQEDEEDEDDMTELCEQLYEDSAKCQQNIQDEDGAYGNLVASSSQEENVCKYIYNVVTGQYDETGFLYMNVLTTNYEDYNGNIVKKYYDSMEGEASIAQIFGLMAGAIGCAVMFIWGCFLKRSIEKSSQPKLIFNEKAELNHGGYIEPAVKSSDETKSVVPEWSTLTPPPADAPTQQSPPDEDASITSVSAYQKPAVAVATTPSLV